MKVAVVCIGRKENLYIGEFVDYYKGIGVDKIFLYDNNFNSEEHFEDVIKDQIDNGFVEVIDFRSLNPAQLESYQDCYNKHREDYDWFIFVDIDEFLHLVNHKDVKEFLSQNKFNNFDVVHLNQIFYGDNNLVMNDGRKMVERFTEPIKPLDFKRTYSFPENDHVKSIIRGGLTNVKWNLTPHTPNNQLRCCNVRGEEQNCMSPFSHPFDMSEAYFKHFFTKTIQEWVEIKSKRGYPNNDKDWFKNHDIFEEFFKLNERTKEKEEYITNLDNNKNLDIFICSHKPFQSSLKSNTYKVINSTDINNDTWNGLKGSFYSEIMTYFYIDENYELKDYVGFCQYRRYWGFNDNIPDMNELFLGCNVIVPKPIDLHMSVREQYASCHNVEDLDLMGDIIKKKFPTYSDVWHFFLNGHFMFPWNMFIMKKEDFKEYIKFMKVCLDEYVNIVGKDIEKRIGENKDKYFKNMYPQNEMWYQYRIGGYLAERLSNLWILMNCKKKKILDAYETNNKYGIR